MNKLAELIEKAHKEAQDVAQAVFDSYQNDFDYLVNKALEPGQNLYVGNGTAFIDDVVKGRIHDSPLIDAASDAQYWDNIAAGFYPKDIYSKPKIK